MSQQPNLRAVTRSLEEILETRKKMAEAFQQVDWQMLALQILRSGSSSPAGGPAASVINSLERHLVARPTNDPVGVQGEEAEQLKKKTNWVKAAAASRTMPPIFSGDVTASARSEVFSIPLPPVRQAWLANVHNILPGREKNVDAGRERIPTPAPDREDSATVQELEQLGLSVRENLKLLDGLDPVDRRKLLKRLREVVPSGER